MQERGRGGSALGFSMGLLRDIYTRASLRCSNSLGRVWSIRKNVVELLSEYFSWEILFIGILNFFSFIHVKLLNYP